MAFFTGLTALQRWNCWVTSYHLGRCCFLVSFLSSCELGRVMGRSTELLLNRRQELPARKWFGSVPFKHRNPTTPLDQTSTLALLYL